MRDYYWELVDDGSMDTVVLIREHGSKRSRTLRLDSVCLIPDDQYTDDGELISGDEESARDEAIDAIVGSVMRDSGFEEEV